MLIEHCDLLSWFHESNGASKHKNHAQDCETLIPEISIRRSCHGFRMSDGVHPFGSNGHLARYAQRPDCCWTLFKHDRFGKPAGAFPDHTPCAWSSPRKSESSSWKTMRKRAQICARKLTTQRRMLCFSSSAL